MKTLIIANLIDNKVLAEATIDQEERLRITVKEPETKANIKAILQDIFHRCETYRTSTTVQDAELSHQTIAKKASGEEKLYAMWDTITGSNYEIGGYSIRAFVRDDER